MYIAVFSEKRRISIVERSNTTGKRGNSEELTVQRRVWKISTMNWLRRYSFLSFSATMP
jgi:hypothetical protein